VSILLPNILTNRREKVTLFDEKWPYSEFGIQAHAQMLRKGIKTSELAKQLGICPAYLCDILRGTRAGKKHRSKIAEILGMIDEKQV
jgi:hypothetical protein